MAVQDKHSLFIILASATTTYFVVSVALRYFSNKFPAQHKVNETFRLQVTSKQKYAFTSDQILQYKELFKDTGNDSVYFSAYFSFFLFIPKGWYRVEQKCIDNTSTYQKIIPLHCEMSHQSSILMGKYTIQDQQLFYSKETISLENTIDTNTLLIKWRDLLFHTVNKEPYKDCFKSQNTLIDDIPSLEYYLSGEHMFVYNTKAVIILFYATNRDSSVYSSVLVLSLSFESIHVTTTNYSLKSCLSSPDLENVKDIWSKAVVCLVLGTANVNYLNTNLFLSHRQARVMVPLPPHCSYQQINGCSDSAHADFLVDTNNAILNCTTEDTDIFVITDTGGNHSVQAEWTLSNISMPHSIESSTYKFSRKWSEVFIEYTAMHQLCHHTRIFFRKCHSTTHLFLAVFIPKLEFNCIYEYSIVYLQCLDESSFQFMKDIAIQFALYTVRTPLNLWYRKPVNITHLISPEDADDWESMIQVHTRITSIDGNEYYILSLPMLDTNTIFNPYSTYLHNLIIQSAWNSYCYINVALQEIVKY